MRGARKSEKRQEEEEEEEEEEAHQNGPVVAVVSGLQRALGSGRQDGHQHEDNRKSTLHQASCTSPLITTRITGGEKQNRR